MLHKPHSLTRPLLGFGIALVLVVAGCSSASTGNTTVDQTTATEASQGGAPEGLCGPVDPNVTLRPLSVGNISSGPSEVFIAWGIQEGCFAKHGLVIDSIPAGGTEKIAALVGGSLDVAAESIMTVARTLGNSEIDLKVLAGHYEATAEQIQKAKTMQSLDDGKLILESAFFVSPDWPFETLDDLRGAKISVSNNVSPTSLGLDRALKEVGIGPTDVERIPLGSSEGLKALIAGEVDAATITGIRAYQALDAGARLVMYPGAYFFEPGPAAAWLTTGTIEESKRSELLAFRDAMREIYSLLDRPEAQESFLTLLKEDFGFDQSAIDQYTFPPLMTREISPQELQYLADALWDEGLIDRQFQFSDVHLVK